MTEKFPEIEDLIPHRLGMKLIDRVLATDSEDVLTAQATVRDDWPMCDQGRLGATLTVELAAQAVGALHGMRALGNKKGRPVVGLLVGVKSAFFHRTYLPVGAELEIEVKSLYGAGGYGAFDCLVKHEGQVVGESSLQVMEPEGDVLNGLLSRGN
ncbi:MAG: hypothetical protein V1816_22920 [Pseudomonadota bacterium]